MFPPVEASVLENNPDFASLYANLTKSVLNPDGTTRADPAAKSRDAVREDLHALRLKAAKRHLLASAIRRAPPQPKLPDPLLDLLFLLPPLLSDDPPEPMLLSSEPFSSLPELLPQLAHLVSASLRASALALARIASPSTNASYLHRAIPALPQTLSALLGSTRALSREKIPAARLAAAASLVPLLHEHTRALARLIHALEAKLGSPQRDLLLRAQMLPLAAEESSLRATLDLHALEREVYAPDVRVAMEGYSRHLRDARARVEQKVRELGITLQGYGVGAGAQGDEAKERVFREMGRVYGEMRMQMKEVEGDLERLRKR